MTKLLKIQNKKYTISLLVIASIMSYTIPSNSQTRNRKSTSGNARVSTKTSSNSRSSLTKSTTSSAVQKMTETSSIQEIDVSTITKYNCENLYNQCMNKTCYNSSNGRCDCNQQTNFDKANENCKYIINACPQQADDIIKTFERNAASDCRNVNLAANNENFKNINNYVADTISCLKPKCKANKSDEFAGCFDDDNLTSRLETCKSSYNGVTDMNEFNKLINQSFFNYKKVYCNKMFGTLKDDGNCYLTIGIGVAKGDIKKTKEFKTGDYIVCSSKFFNTSMGKDEAAKLKHIKNITLSGISMVQQGVSLAGNISAYGANATTVVNVLNIANTGLGAAQDVVELATKDFSYSGKCFVINDGKVHELFPENNDIAYKLRWAENWDDTIYDAN